MAFESFHRIPFDNKTLMQLMINDKSTPMVVGKIDRADTARQCIIDFIKSCHLVFDNCNPENFDVMILASVGLRIDGRRSQYDLIWYPHHPNYGYAIDVHDKMFVARVYLKLDSCAH